MNYLQILGFSKSRSEQEKAYIKFIKNTTGHSPINLFLYQLAIKHTSTSRINKIGVRENNERLEFLGDSVLDLIVAEHLFRLYPIEDEGFLTEIRSRIVNREQINRLAHEIGLVDFVQVPGSISHRISKHSYIYGNAMEAFIGAIYLDIGFKKTQKIILKLIKTYLNIREIITRPYNFKSILLEWSQKKNRNIVFETSEPNKTNISNRFSTLVKLDDKVIGRGMARNKKKSEQNAAEEACLHLKLIEI